MANEADILRDKIKADDHSDKGVSPTFRPKRKRGFYRALKRGESWAVIQDNMNKMTFRLYKETLKENILLPSPFLGLLATLN